MLSLKTTILGAAILLFTLGPGGQAGAETLEGRSRASWMVAQADDDPAATSADSQGSVAALTVRMDRMENTIRSLTGQVEQLQFQNRKLTDDLRKMQQDVDFRFQDLGRGGNPIGTPAKSGLPAKRSELESPVGTAGLPQDASGVAAPTVIEGEAVRTARKTGDAFDPAANPDAPGAPRALGSTAPSTPLSARAGIAATNAPSAPMELMRHAATPSIIDQSTENGVAAVPPSSIAPVDEPSRPVANTNVVASLVPGGTRDEFNADLDLYKQGQFDGAATGLKGFLDKYPRDRMVPDAVYLLGEAYTRLGRHREAAEQYLRLSTDFGKAPRAPDALLRLGMSLNAMGVREQACATYQEVSRRYPTASTDVKTNVDREMKRAHC